MILPTLERVFDALRWLRSKLKHSIEPRANFRAVSGIDQYCSTIRYDDMEILSNTSEVEYSLANRFLDEDPGRQTLLSANTQVTYNTSCCAFSGQYRLFNVGTRNENQFRVALVIANIGSFGTLRRQDRLF